MDGSHWRAEDIARRWPPPCHRRRCRCGRTSRGPELVLAHEDEPTITAILRGKLRRIRLCPFCVKLDVAERLLGADRAAAWDDFHVAILDLPRRGPVGGAAPPVRRARRSLPSKRTIASDGGAPKLAAGVTGGAWGRVSSCAATRTVRSRACGAHPKAAQRQERLRGTVAAAHRLHPARYSRCRYWFASALLVKRMLAPSYCSFTP